MKNINDVKFKKGTKEEMLPEFAADFPYIASRVELDKCIGGFVPWHWHKEIELFYIEKGVLEYYTPKGKITFPAGSAGIVNSNILHMTKSQENIKNTVQFIHIFATSFIGGQTGSRIEQKYITPFISASQIEIIALYPNISEHIEILDKIRMSFELENNSYDYEIILRSILSEIWSRIFLLSNEMLEEKRGNDRINDELKMMMLYIYEHYTEKISILEIANYAFISERKCFRIFKKCLHMTPMEYIKSYRLQMACHMLAKGQETITFIGYASGLGSSSYFGKIFHEEYGCSPKEYRKKWQNNDIERQK